MSARQKFHFSSSRYQRGAVLMLLLLLVSVGALAVFVSGLNRATHQLERDRITTAALAQAKEALIGYALRGDDGSTPSRPGVFLCPDVHVPSDPLHPANDPLYGTSSTPCNDGTIGRFPWRSLKMPELLDGSGSPLWYSLSGNFRSSLSVINSDSKGTLQVRAADGATLLTQPGSEATAILFSPGEALAGQLRGSAAEKTTASNYLEAASGINNAIGLAVAGNCNVLNQGTPAQTSCPTFVAGNKSNTFNDRLLVVAPRDLLPVVERRVAKVAETVLTGYFTICGYYPRPALFSNTACLPGGSVINCKPDSMATQGRFPYYARTGGNLFTDWVGLPAWFLSNRWDRVIYYAVAPGYVRSAPSQICPGNCLTVDGSPLIRRLVVVPGNATTVGNPRPSILLTDYLGDVENTDLNNIFATPTAATLDQMFKLPRAGAVDDSSLYSPLTPNPACD